MPKIEPDQRDIIEEFFDSISDEFPTLTLKQCLEICRSPFKFVKYIIKSTTYPEVRFKYWGSYTVKPYRALDRLRRMERITKERGFNQLREDKMQTLREYLVRNPPVIYSKIKKEKEQQNQNIQDDKREN